MMQRTSGLFSPTAEDITELANKITAIFTDEKTPCYGFEDFVRKMQIEDLVKSPAAESVLKKLIVDGHANLVHKKYQINLLHLFIYLGQLNLALKLILAP